MALGGVPGLEGLGLEGMGNMGTPLGGGLGTSVGGALGGGGARADEEERRRRLGVVMDVLKVCLDIFAAGIEDVLTMVCRQTKADSAKRAWRDWHDAWDWSVYGKGVWEVEAVHEH